MKFQKNRASTKQEIPTASMPDIVFMLLFFFMTTTVMREVDLLIQVKVPEATQAKKLEKKSLVSFIYVGKPLPSYQGLFGTEPRLQLNDQFKEVPDIQDFIAQERDAMDENDRNKMMVSLKVDEKTKMGVIVDTKLALRRAQAYKISYSSLKVEKLR